MTPDRRKDTTWSDADMTHTELNVLFSEPYPYEAIIDPKPNVSEREQVDGNAIVGIQNIIIFEAVAILICWGAFEFWRMYAR